MFTITKKFFVFFALVLLVVLSTACGTRHVRAYAPTVTPLPMADQNRAPEVQAARTQVQTPVNRSVSAAPSAFVNQNAVVIGQIEDTSTVTSNEVLIPTALPGQDQGITDGQIIAAINAIHQKLGNNQSEMDRVNRELGDIGSGDRPKLEAFVKSYMTAGEFNSLHVVEPQDAPNMVLPVKVPPADVAQWKELVLGEFPVTKGKPFKEVQEYKDNAESIVAHLRKLNYPQVQLDAAVAAFKACIDGDKFWATNPLWKTGNCKYVQGGEFPYIEQTTGGLNTKTGRETGVTKNMKCTEPACASGSMVLAYFDQKFSRWYLNYNICRGNPAVPLQERPATFKVTRQEALCRSIVASESVVTQPEQVLKFKIDTAAQKVSNIEWFINGNVQPETGLEVQFPEKRFPREQKSVVAFKARGMYPAESGVAQASDGPLECQTTVENRVLVEKPIPACTSSEVIPNVVSSSDSDVEFRTNITSTGRMFIPIVFSDGAEIYRGKPTMNFTGVKIRLRFKASGAQHITFRAIDAKTSAILFECLGDAERTTVTYTEPLCFCDEIHVKGGTVVKEGKAIELTVKRSSDGVRASGYWRFTGTTTQLSHGDEYTVTYSNFATVFGHDPELKGEAKTIEFVDVDRDGKESVNPRCQVLITFFPPKVITHRHFCGPAAIYCWGPPVAAGALYFALHNGNQKIDFGRIGVNGKTFMDEKKSTKQQVWRFVKTYVIPFPTSKSQLRF